MLGCGNIEAKTGETLTKASDAKNSWRQYTESLNWQWKGHAKRKEKIIK